MMRLPNAIAAWGTPEFEETLKQELVALAVDALPLQQGLAAASYVEEDGRSFMLLAAAETAEAVSVKVGVFYRGVIAGCSCADDPTPVDTTSEYCELQLEIDRRSALTRVTLLPG